MKFYKHILFGFIFVVIFLSYTIGQGLSSDGSNNNGNNILGEIEELEKSQNCIDAGGTPLIQNGSYYACEYNGVEYSDSEIITTNNVQIFCAQNKQYTEDGVLKCCPGMVVPSQENPGQEACIINNEGDVGINMNSGCLINGQCSYNIYETLGIRKSDPNPKVGTFVQDIILAATTFIGTVVALMLVTSGILYVVASIKGSSNLADMAKKGVFGSIYGILLVAGSYAIIRLIQFLATAGGG